MKRLLAIGWLLALSACGDTGQERVRVALRAQGTARSESKVGDATFRLTRADLVFGPSYFCATNASQSALCETAIAELTEPLLVNGLSPSVVPIGELSATTGEIRSAFYDFGVSYLLTHTAPLALTGLAGGHSAWLEGTVERAGELRSFRALVDVRPKVAGANAVSAQPVDHEILGEGEALTIQVDPYAWLASIDVDALFALPVSASGLTLLEDDSQPYVAIVQAMQNRARVSFAFAHEAQ